MSEIESVKMNVKISKEARTRGIFFSEIKIVGI